MHISFIFKPENDQNYVNFVKSEVRLQKAPVKNHPKSEIGRPKTLYSPKLDAPMLRF